MSDNPKIYVEVMKQGIKIQFANLENLIFAKMILIDAIEAINKNIASNSTVQEKSDIVIPEPKIIVPQ